MEELVLKTYVASLCKTKKYGFTLFTQDRNYSIPGYQRPYEWSNEKIENMMSSLFDFYQGGIESYNKDALLFGTIQLNVNSDNEYEIIDGQQRLVSFYLLIKALKELEPSIKIPDFKVENYIQDDYNQSFRGADESNNDSLYGINYRRIKKILYDSSEVNLRDLFDMVVSRVKFVVIITKNITTIERTLQIFTALNTTGLPLDVKDVFKVKFCDFLSKNKGYNDTQENIKKVNEAYALLEDLNDTNEDDLLDVYRFYLLGKAKQGTSNNLKCSNEKFFNDIFDSSNYSDIKKSMKADDVFNIAQVMQETERLLQNKRQNIATTSESICFLARDLMNWSGYGRLKNLLYYFVLCLNPSDFHVTEEIVDNACSMLLDLSCMCSLYRMYYSKILNEVFRFVLDNIINCDSSLDPSVLKASISDFLKDKERKYLLDNYNALLLGTSSVFDNSRVHYFLLLSYAEDCYIAKETLEKCYLDILHRAKWDIDIEHIHSQKFFDNSPISKELGGSLGNLMYLESGINRTLGKDIKDSKVKNSKDDYYGKKTKGNGYKKSKLVSTKVFMSKYANEEDWTEELVKARSRQKQGFINNIFKRILPTIITQ